MSDTTIDLKGATELEQRQLQTMIKMIGADIVIDGKFGPNSKAAFQEIIAKHVPDADATMSIHEAIETLKEIAETHAPEVDVSDKPISEAEKGDIKYVQNLINIIDPDVMSKRGIDGLNGAGTQKALATLLPEGMDPATASMNEIITELEGQLIDLPERHFVDDCQNLTVIARKHYADDIKEYTKQLMESGDPKYASEEAARVHAEQIAVNKIATANELDKGPDDAHTIFPDQILEIPEAGPLKDVDATLDWEALDAKVGPGGPCIPCTGGDTPLTGTFTPVSTPPITIPELPKLGDDCTVTYVGKTHGFLGLGQEKDTYRLEGTSGEGFHDLKRALEREDIRTHGNCKPEPENDDDDPSPVGHVGSVADTVETEEGSQGINATPSVGSQGINATPSVGSQGINATPGMGG